MFLINSFITKCATVCVHCVDIQELLMVTNTVLYIHALGLVHYYFYSKNSTCLADATNKRILKTLHWFIIACNLYLR